MQQCKSLISAERCTLFLIDVTKSQLWSVLADGVRERIVVPLSNGVAGHVAQTGQPMRVDNAAAEEYFASDVDSRTHFKTKSLLTIPINSPSTSNVIGVLQAINKDDAGADAFSEDDQELLWTLRRILLQL